MIKISRDVTSSDGAFLAIVDSFISNGDGSFSAKASAGFPNAGQYIGQEPNVYGLLNWATEIGAYQKFTVDGQLITFWTRAQDKAYSYTWVTVNHY